MQLLSLIALLGFVLTLNAECIEEAMDFCREKCECSKSKKAIKCFSMKNLWFLVTEGAKYVEEFAEFDVTVSDDDLSKIDRKFSLKEGDNNGLRKIFSLTLSTFKSLKSIHSSFFQDHFPNLEYLTVTESDNELEALTIGRLPLLRSLQINGHELLRIEGCDPKYRYCFSEQKMDLLQVPTLNLKSMGLPEYITKIKIDLNDANVDTDDNEADNNNNNNDENVFKGIIVVKLDLTISKSMCFPAQFSHIGSVDEFNFEIPPMKEEKLHSLVKSVQETPFLSSRMNLKIKTKEHKMDVKFPVIMKSCQDCDFEKVSLIGDENGVCFEEQQYLDTFNTDIPQIPQSNRSLTIRGIFVDIDALLDVIEGDSSFHVTIYTFIAKVPKKLHVNFDLRVYYAVLQREGELSQDVTIKKPYTVIKMEDQFGVPLQYAKTLDGIFVHQYSLCIAKLAMKYKDDSPDNSFVRSVPWKMFLSTPNYAIHSSSSEPLVKSRTLGIQSLLHKYMYQYAEDEKRIKQLPPHPLYIQEELAEILINSARHIIEKRRDFGMRKNVHDLLNVNVFHINAILDHEDEKQISFLEDEQRKTMRLANLALTREDIFQSRLKKIRQVLQDQLSTSDDLGNDLDGKTKSFITGALGRNAYDWANIASDVAYSIISGITVGGFDYCAVTKKALEGGRLYVKLKNITSSLNNVQELMEKLKTIRVICNKGEKASEDNYKMLKKSVEKLDNAMNPKERTTYSGLLKRISNGLGNIEDIGEAILTLYQNALGAKYESKLDTLATQELNTIRMWYNLEIKDIMEWNLVEDKVKCLIDEEVTVKIPESAEFKAAVLRMITVGKTITQLRVTEAQIMSEIMAAEKNYWERIEDYAALRNAVDDIKEAGARRHTHNDINVAKEEYQGHYKKTQKYLFYVTFINKLRLIGAHHDYCKGYYYFHLSECPSRFDIDIFTPLDEVARKYENLVFDYTIKKPLNFNPPPQPFENFAVIVKKEANCHCVSDPYERLKDIQKDRNITGNEKKKFLELTKLACFPQERSNASSKAVFAKLERCKTAVVDNFIKHRTISIEIPVNYQHDFTTYEHVRIDDVKVVLDGVKTANGKVSIRIANTGLIQDRYHGLVDKFYISQWVRSYEYCVKDIKKLDGNKADVANDVSSSCHRNTPTTLLATSIHNDYSGFHLKPSLFATWVITVPEDLNPGLDLFQVNSIEIDFSGSLIPGNTNYGEYDVNGNAPDDDDDDDDDLEVKREWTPTSMDINVEKHDERKRCMIV